MSQKQYTFLAKSLERTTSMNRKVNSTKRTNGVFRNERDREMFGLGWNQALETMTNKLIALMVRPTDNSMIKFKPFIDQSEVEAVVKELRGGMPKKRGRV